MTKGKLPLVISVLVCRQEKIITKAKPYNMCVYTASFLLAEKGNSGKEYPVSDTLGNLPYLEINQMFYTFSPSKGRR